ncbi:MAG: DUF3943 domain-containing protein [Deltaproteobacteria bacterium]|nr:DUF3943 domain-containing protein [Deltaproteobacteria bacterium]
MKKQQFFLLYLTLVFIILAQIGNSAISETIFGDDSIMSMTPANSSVFIDLRDKNKANINFRKELNDKSLADFSDFLRDSRNVYFTIWLIRIIQVNALDVHNKEQQTFINPLRWWRNFFGFQNKSRKRGDFELKDGDSFKTNWVAHPAFGAYTYLYYRAKGYNFYTSALGSFAQSVLFEYTIEGVTQSPSIHDLIITPGVGVPVGIILEETSSWLVERENGLLNVMGYIVNPMRIIVPERDKVNVGPLISGQLVIGFQW